MAGKRKGGIWDQVRTLVEEGKSPIITLTPEQEVTEPRKSSGRPAATPDERQFKHYLGNTRPVRSRPRCYNRGCYKLLRRDDHIVCSDYCRQEVVKEARKLLVNLEGDAWRIPLPRTRREEVDA